LTLDFGLQTLDSVNVLIAPDKFKGTLTAREAAQAIARGWRKARPADHLGLLPISDGGDGFGAVMSARLNARPQRTKTVDAAHRPCLTTWWWDADSKTAIVESARIVGLAMLPTGKFHPFQLDTFGLGAVLRAAQLKGARQIILGIGGSATNDGGFGLARALGWRFVDAGSKDIKDWTGLHKLAAIRAPRQTKLPNVTVAVDVQNKLLGARGATRIYGPQKGIRPEDFAAAEACLRQMALVFKRQTGRDVARHEGTGAAGGLGFGLKAFAAARLAPGFDLFARRAKLHRQLQKAELVITGEGALDDSTVMGKGVGELARACRKLGIPCLGLAGRAVRTPAVKSMFRIVEGLTDFLPVNVALGNPEKHLARLSERVATRWK
jgi:glycerate 2-kinase